MATWIFLILISGFALYIAIDLHRTTLILACTFAFLLACIFLVLRVVVISKMKREIGLRR